MSRRGRLLLCVCVLAVGVLLPSPSAGAAGSPAVCKAAKAMKLQQARTAKRKGRAAKRRARVQRRKAVTLARRCAVQRRSRKPVVPAATATPAAPVAAATAPTIAPVAAGPVAVAPVAAAPEPATPAAPEAQPVAAAQGKLLFSTSYASRPAVGTNAVSGIWRAAQVPNHGDDASGVREWRRITLVDSPGATADTARPSGGAMRVELRPYNDPAQPAAADGDVTDTGGYLANRAEVYDRIETRGTDPKLWPDPVGSVRWYSFAIFIPQDFQFGARSQWLTLTQWKGLNGGGPPVALELQADRFVLAGKTFREDLGAVTPGRWTRFEVGLSLAPTSADGWVEVARDGRTALARKAVATMETYVKDGKTLVDPVYLKQGIYRSVMWDTTAVVHFGPLRIGTTRSAVG